MPRDLTTGIYSTPAASVAVAGQPMSSAGWNTLVADWGNEITNTLDPRGETPMAANLNMGSQKITGLANGSASTDMLAYGQLSSVAGFPVGAMIAWPNKEAAPSNWLICSGSASRTAYATLFALLGTNYGTGDGSTTFGLPNNVFKHADTTTIIRAA